MIRFRSKATAVGAVLAAAVALAGCTLIDQRTFERAGKAPTADELARANLPDVPLLTIRLDSADTDIQPAVTEAAEAVLGRKPDAQYEVVAAIPTSDTPQVQATFAKLGEEDTTKVVNALGYAGVSLDNVHVAYRGDPGAPPLHEVLVYVR